MNLTVEQEREESDVIRYGCKSSSARRKGLQTVVDTGKVSVVCLTRAGEPVNKSKVPWG